MKKPVIFLVDDDPQVLRAIQRDLNAQFREDYRIIAADSPEQALESLPELKAAGQRVALFISDQRMPKMEGVDFLEKAQKLYPQAKRMLLTAYSDTEAAIKAINEVQLDYYLLKPWDPPEEKLYPVVQDMLDEWQDSYRPDRQGIVVVGQVYSPQLHELKTFLSGNLIPYYSLDFDRDNAEVKKLGRRLNLTQEQLPWVVLNDDKALASPTARELATKMGMGAEAKAELYDVVIIGSGPAGMAAAVYGGSEGLKTLMIERKVPGGQAGTSSRIENYLGFPKGLSGAELTRRAMAQATRFGVEFLDPGRSDGSRQLKARTKS